MNDLIERIPPQSLDAEASVLSACLRAGPVAVAEAQGEGLQPEHCYLMAHGAILRAIYGLAAKGEPIDLVMLRDHFAEDQETFMVAFEATAGTMGGFTPVAHVAWHARKIVAMAHRRDAIQALADSMGDLFDLGTDDPVSAAQARIMAVGATAYGNKSEATSFGAVVLDTFEALNETLNGSGAERDTRAFETGLYDLDQMVWVEPGETVILGARPSDGKTALALQVMLHAAGDGKRVLFHSLEMGAKQIALRYLASRSRASIYRLRQGYATLDERGRLAHAAGLASDLPFILDGRPALTVAQIATSLRREMQRGRVDALFVDHLLKVRPADARGTRHAQMTQVVGDLVSLGKQTGVSIFGLYQLNRSSSNEQREPRLSDFRESGSVEEDADHAWLIHRPDHSATSTEAKLLVAKNRNGPVGAVNLNFTASTMTFACRESSPGEDAA